MRTFLAGSVVALMVLVSGPAARAATITVGASTGGNVFPFGCGVGCFGPATPGYVGEYQQIYAASAFPGPFNIEQIAFRTLNAGEPVSSSFTLSLGTTSASPSSPGSNYAANIRPDLTPVFSGVVSVASTGGGTFDFVIDLAVPFLYDPSIGNLLLDVFINSNDPGSTSFAFGTGNADVGRVYNPSGTGSPTAGAGHGLQTLFSDVPGTTTPVPEPTSLSLMVIGVTIAGLRRWNGARQVNA